MRVVECRSVLGELIAEIAIYPMPFAALGQSPETFFKATRELGEAAGARWFLLVTTDRSFAWQLARVENRPLFELSTRELFSISRDVPTSGMAQGGEEYLSALLTRWVSAVTRNARLREGSMAFKRLKKVGLLRDLQAGFAPT